jgi:hypothetical protein
LLPVQRQPSDRIARTQISLSPSIPFIFSAAYYPSIIISSTMTTFLFTSESVNEGHPGMYIHHLLGNATMGAVPKREPLGPRCLLRFLLGFFFMLVIPAGLENDHWIAVGGSSLASVSFLAVA